VNAKTKERPAVVDATVAPNNLPAVHDPRQQQEAPKADKQVAIISTERKIYPGAIAKAILSVTREVGRIHKASRNTFQNYNYASWQDVNDRLAPLLADNDLLIVQSEVSRNLIEENDKGSTLAIVYEFTIVNGAGEQWPPIQWTATSRLRDGKGVTDDKAAPKCATQAEKYFCIKTFKIRTTDDIDNDADDGRGGGKSAAPAAKESRMVFDKLQGDMLNQPDSAALMKWMSASLATIDELPTGQRAELRMNCSRRLGELRAAEDKAARDAAEKAAPEWSNSEVDSDWRAEAEAPPPAAPEPEGFDAMPPVKQAGIMCGDAMFWAFLRETRGVQVGAVEEAAAIVRQHCIVTSRKDIRNNHPSGRLWRELVAEYRAWQRGDEPAREPDGLEEILPPLPSPQRNPAQLSHAAEPAASASASRPAPATEAAGAPADDRIAAMVAAETKLRNAAESGEAELRSEWFRLPKWMRDDASMVAAKEKLKPRATQVDAERDPR